MRLIDVNKLIDYMQENRPLNWTDTDAEKQEQIDWEEFILLLEQQPTIDAVPVVRCHECILHDNCNTEEAYKLCRIENPFCCAGKRREPQAEAVEENSFLMQRFMKQE